jgi:hypothetical protein
MARASHGVRKQQQPPYAQSAHPPNQLVGYFLTPQLLLAPRCRRARGAPDPEALKEAAPSVRVERIPVRRLDPVPLISD